MNVSDLAILRFLVYSLLPESKYYGGNMSRIDSLPNDFLTNEEKINVYYKTKLMVRLHRYFEDTDYCEFKKFLYEVGWVDMVKEDRFKI